MFFRNVKKVQILSSNIRDRGIWVAYNLHSTYIWTIIKLINNLLVNYMTASGLGLLHLLGPDYG